MSARFQALAPAEVSLGPGVFQYRAELNRRYLLSLTLDNLLQNHYLEAGLGGYSRLRNSSHGDADSGDHRHWGWESPTCQVRGQFLGHWMSAAARLGAGGDAELRLRLEQVVRELARCQVKNGGEWVFSIPEKYLHWTAQGMPTWAPQYVIHKTLMGLLDAHLLTGNAQALDIALNAARWFHRWSGGFTRAQLDDILDVETGGMLEAWANIYGITGAREHLDLIERYTRDRLFTPLLDGQDVLTNMHANHTIPEVQGAARAYEVTGDARWRRIVEAYWRCAVDERGFFATGGQTCGEIWTPPFAFAARLGQSNQEHCTVYNMIRLAEYLFRWTGDARYGDYIERNLYNGILAQQHRWNGMVTYYLPLEPGAHKHWGHPTWDFWCCHGSLVQAQALYPALACYRGEGTIAINQYIPCRVQTEIQGTPVTLALTHNALASGSMDNNANAAGPQHRPAYWAFTLQVNSAAAVEFTLAIRLPGWRRDTPRVWVNGDPQPVDAGAPAFLNLARRWTQDQVRIELPTGLTSSPIPDEPDTVAFLNGPVVLAGLCERERMLYGDPARPETMLAPDNEREGRRWLGGYRTIGQAENFRFKPLYEIVDEPYTVYFPVRPALK